MSNFCVMSLKLVQTLIKILPLPHMFCTCVAHVRQCQTFATAQIPTLSTRSIGVAKVGHTCATARLQCRQPLPQWPRLATPMPQPDTSVDNLFHNQLVVAKVCHTCATKCVPQCIVGFGGKIILEQPFCLHLWILALQT